jgi:DNA replication and repair protein RecF
VYLSHLSLTDFRSYAEAELALEPGITALVGPNGEGKTNLVEGVGYLATLGSHRVASDAPLIRLGADRAIVRGTVVSAGRSALVEIEVTPGKSNRARLNRSPVRSAREVLGVFRSVLFAPEDLALIKGDPAGRRRFLDDLLVAQTPRLAGVRADYERVLKQRNALLKSAGTAIRASRGGDGVPDLRTLDVWDSHLASAGAQLLAARLELIDTLRPLVVKAYDAVASADGTGTGAGAEVRMEYKSSLDADGAGADGGLSADREVLAAALLETTGRLRKAEIERGVSLVGPHRDDLVLSLGALPTKGYASQGESWSFALALRLASYDLLRADGDDPVLVLDDVFAELDSGRRDRLAELVSPCEQVLVTAAVPSDVPDGLAGARVDVMDGELRKVR